jgi:hypothetical protein
VRGETFSNASLTARGSNHAPLFLQQHLNNILNLKFNPIPIIFMVSVGGNGKGGL